MNSGPTATTIFTCNKSLPRRTPGTINRQRPNSMSTPSLWMRWHQSSRIDPEHHRRYDRSHVVPDHSCQRYTPSARAVQNLNDYDSFAASSTPTRLLNTDIHSIAFSISRLQSQQEPSRYQECKYDHHFSAEMVSGHRRLRSHDDDDPLGNRCGRSTRVSAILPSFDRISDPDAQDVCEAAVIFPVSVLTASW
jgi:hypothetical protein